MASSEESFSTQMRKVTRKVHSISYGLVQSKFLLGESVHSICYIVYRYQKEICICTTWLGKVLRCPNIPGLINDQVWVEGLLVFYEVYAFLESSIQRQLGTAVGKFDHPALKRKAAFEEDLSVFYGADWKITHRPKDRKCVRLVLAHLEELEKSDPVLLTAYIYHLYLGLLSGGQVLRRKQKLMKASSRRESSVVNFDPMNIQELKAFIKDTMNEVAESMDKDTRKRILDESLKVFEFNRSLIGSIQSSNDALIKIVGSLAFVAVIGVLVVKFYQRRT